MRPPSPTASGSRRSLVPAIPAHTEFAGKKVSVTGANVGLGIKTVRDFLRLRSSLVITGVRLVGKGEAAVAALRREFLDVRIEASELDMESFRSVQAFAARAERELDRPEKCDGFDQYGLSKLLVMMFVAKLAKTINLQEVIVNCTDPGATKGTAFFRNVNSWIMSIALRAFMGLIGR